MVRVVLYLVFIINEGNNYNANLLTIALVLCFYAIITNRLSVYKYWPLCVLENFFLINLIFLSCTLTYFQSNNNDGVKIVIVSGGLSLVVYLGIIIHHLYVQLKGNSILKRVTQMIKYNKSVTLPPMKVSLTVNPPLRDYGSCECREPVLEFN